VKEDQTPSPDGGGWEGAVRSGIANCSARVTREKR